MRRAYRHLSPYAYLAAVVALLATGAWAIVNRRFDIYVQAGLGLAALGIAVGVLLDPDRLRAALSGRRARYGSNALLLSFAFTGILVVINYFAYSNPKQWDLTEDEQFTLAPETIDLLSGLDQDVRILGFYTPDSSSSRDSLRPLLDEYRNHSNGHVQYEFIDPVSDPVAADQYGVTRDRSIVVLVGDASEVIDFPTEEALTSAILRLTNPGARKVVFLAGHGERDLDDTSETGYSQLRSALEAKNYEVVVQDLLIEPDIPTDALAVIVAGPNTALSDGEIETLRQYQSGGGALVAFVDPTVITGIEPGSDLLVEYLQTDWGVEVEDDLVVDLNSTAPFAGISFNYASHPITDKLNRLRTYFPTARSLALAPAESSTLTQTELVQTGDNSWGETDHAAILAGDTLQFDDGSDHPGPLTLAAAVENPQTGARLVLVGDSDFAANSNYFGGSSSTVQFANGDLAVNSIDWSAGQESLISLTPKPQTTRFVVPPTIQTVGLIFLITVIVIPGGVVVGGLSTWWQRRRRA